MAICSMQLTGPPHGLGHENLHGNVSARPAPLAFCAPRQRAFSAAAAGRPGWRLGWSSRSVTAGASTKGFDARRTTGKKKAPKLARLLEDEDIQVAAVGQQQGSSAEGWTEVTGIDAVASFVSKPIRPVILPTGRAVCLVKVGSTIYCSDANSTAFKYPLADANLLQLKGGTAVEVALDGTVYDLATGKVVSWCPKNTLGRRILCTLKDRTQPVDLPVYPVRIQGSKVFVQLS